MTRYPYRYRYRGRNSSRDMLIAAGVGVVLISAASPHAIHSISHHAAAPAASGSNEALANSMAASGYGWTGSETTCLDELWTEESGFVVNATNSQSGAYGIPQALPASKMASAGADWQTNPATQIRWGLGYIAGRYGTPCGAWNFETSHTPNWY